MTKAEIVDLIDGYIANLPERISGNEENKLVAARLRTIVQTNRVALVAVLRDWIGARIPAEQRKLGDGVVDGSMWLALEIARTYRLTELRLDLERLLVAVRRERPTSPTTRP